MQNKMRPETTSFSLHIMAMIFMLCDHLWATVIPGNDWLNCIGRLAFPVFAFMIVEGYFHTKNLKKYVLRLVIFAVISEIPFNLVAAGTVFYPLSQNVLWTFLISIILIHINEKAKYKHIITRAFVLAATVFAGYIGGIITFVDYHGAGVLTCLVFYIFRERKWWCYAAQLLILYYINFEMLGGISYEIQFFGQTYFIARQGFAILSLIPIWLYRGNKGYSSKLIKYINYVFYPAHLFVLGLIRVL